jgi:hypothetical protein
MLLVVNNGRAVLFVTSLVTPTNTTGLSRFQGRPSAKICGLNSCLLRIYFGFVSCLST